MPQSTPIPVRAYEDSHDYLERMSNVLYNLMRSGLDVNTSTFHIRDAVTAACKARFPKDPATVSAREFAHDVMRICETYLKDGYKYDTSYKNFMIGLEDDWTPASVPGTVADPSRAYRDWYDQRMEKELWDAEEAERSKQRQREAAAAIVSARDFAAKQHFAKRKVADATTTRQNKTKKRSW